MAVPTTLAEALALLPDNTVGDISELDMREIVTFLLRSIEVTDGGGTPLAIGAVADGQTLQRSGSSIIGVASSAGAAGLETPWRATTRYGAPRVEATPLGILANTLYAYPIKVPSSVPINKISIIAQPTTGSFKPGTSIRMGVYSEGIALPVTLEANSEGFVDDTVLTGADAVAAEATLGTPPTLTRSVRWLAFVTNKTFKVHVILSTGDRSIDLNLGKLPGTITEPGSAAIGSLDFGFSNPVDDDSATLPEFTGGGTIDRVFVFKDTPVGQFDVQIGADAEATRDNLKTTMDILFGSFVIGDFNPTPVSGGLGHKLNLTQPVAGSGGNVAITTAGSATKPIPSGFSGGTSLAGDRGLKDVNGVKVAFPFAALPTTFPTPVTYIGDQDFVPHVMVEAQTDGAAV